MFMSFKLDSLVVSPKEIPGRMSVSRKLLPFHVIRFCNRNVRYNITFFLANATSCCGV